MIRAGFRLLLDSVAEIEVVGEASDGAQAVELAGSARADIVLMDISLEPHVSRIMTKLDAHDRAHSSSPPMRPGSSRRAGARPDGVERWSRTVLPTGVADGCASIVAVTTLDLTPDDVLTTTRSVRKRLDLERPVPLELVRECLDIALQAPSGSNRQSWHWIVVTDAEQRAAIGEFYRRAVARYLESSGAAGKLFSDDPARSAVQSRVGDSVAYLGERMGQVPVLLIPCLAVPKLPEGNQAGLWGSLLPAAWSYMLAARARGLGTAWTTLHLTYEAEVAELLGLPEHIRQAALIPTAYSVGTNFKPAAREPLDNVLHVNNW